MERYEKFSATVISTATKQLSEYNLLHQFYISLHDISPQVPENFSPELSFDHIFQNQAKLTQLWNNHQTWQSF